jgi:hypothetical protein
MGRTPTGHWRSYGRSIAMDQRTVLIGIIVTTLVIIAAAII